jgi:hypothetical protein
MGKRRVSGRQKGLAENTERKAGIVHGKHRKHGRHRQKALTGNRNLFTESTESTDRKQEFVHRNNLRVCVN